MCSLVDGSWSPGTERCPDLNPSRPDDVLGIAEFAGAEIAAAAATAAFAAFGPWSELPAPARGEILRRAGELLDARAESIGYDLAREEGKTYAEGVGETRRAAAIFRYYAGQTLEADGETFPSTSAQTFLFARREPVGVIAAITPWNFPIAIPAWKLAPALAYGNCVVWKPAELVPLTSVRLIDVLLDAGVPNGVVNLVIGRGDIVGEAVAAHDSVAAISFTGSNSVGRKLHERAIERGKKVQLELGGKNPAIVLADADLELAAEQVARGAFLSAGQKCTATSRVLVERSVLEPFVELLAVRAREWKLGDALEPTTKVGPVASDEQLTTVLGFLDLARSEGASAVAGGSRADECGHGYFVRPTVLVDLDPSSRVVQEEIFGPVAAVLPVDSYDEALHAANDTPFGLTASLFTNDLGRALRFARGIRAGVVKINQESAGLEYHVPFGGMKTSSSGTREQGKAAREFYTEWKTVYVDSGSS